MTLIHVLGGASLLILVAVSTVIRAGIGVDRGEGAPSKPETVEAAAAAAAAEAAEAVEEPAAVLVAPPFGPLLDRMGA
ncbi:hypothetical protein [Stenotrophomonas sp. PD6]|uniref:hypothetical protein n=1 Tax=Stenotrophomonas sp. PD6 TaxID=3368612 RepID=UPI003BA237FD